MTNTQQTQSLASFTTAYIETALWSSTYDNNIPLDRDHSVSDIAPETLAKIIADCESFQAANAEWITEEHMIYQSQYSSDEMAGHDFWLTRNGHGAGFWDGDWSDAADAAMTKSSKAFGQCDLYVGDDGRIYL